MAKTARVQTKKVYPSGGSTSLSIGRLLTGAWAAGALLGLAARPAVAGAPFITDDPGIVPYGHNELYVASQGAHTPGNWSGDVHIEYNRGIYPNVMAHVIVSDAYNDPSGGLRATGRGDTELGIKYQFVDQNASIPAVAIFPLAEVPSGNETKHLGTGHTMYFLPVWAQKDWGEGWETYGGGGYWIDNNAGGKNHWFMGWELSKALSEQLTFGGEIFHQTDPGYGLGANSGFNVGGIYDFDSHNHLLFSAGKGVQNVDLTDQLMYYAAYEWTW
ncbi:MAG: transporter [Betaproteobacteria bacterium]|nr:transporter [Betaproteobacteria bacterium]